MRAGYGKEESRKEHKAGSGKGGLNYCEIKENKACFEMMRFDICLSQIYHISKVIKIK